MSDLLYTRAIRIDEHFYELEPEDQVDVSLVVERSWITIVRIGKHDDDPDQDDVSDDMFCEGTCHTVLFFTDDDCSYPWHVQNDDEIYARFPATDVSE